MLCQGMIKKLAQNDITIETIMDWKIFLLAKSGRVN